MNNLQTFRLKSIADYHSLVNIAKPVNPLFSVINFEDTRKSSDCIPQNLVFDFYTIALKKNFNGRIKYGQKEYSFNDGIMVFMSPEQVLSIEANKNSQHSGWLLFIHPDFLLNTPLASKIKKYEYFDYAVNEALFLSETEEITVKTIMENINQEYNSKDDFSQELIIAQIELLLIYAERFYNRQFTSHKNESSQILNQLEDLLTEYFNYDVLEKGLPTVQYIAEKLNFSPNYLSTLLKLSTGQSTQQHIHNKLIEKAKEKLSITDLSVSEISYALGFEHSQSFSKLFKSKTNLSPLDFRRSFQLQK